MASNKTSKGLLAEQKDMEESYHEMLSNQKSVNSAWDDDVNHRKEKKCISCNKCSYKCVFFSCTLTQILIVLIAILAIIFEIAPQFAQNTLDNSSMDIISGSIYNPTNSSITMNTTIQISNAGFLSGEIHSSTVTVTNNGIQFAKMTLPTITTTANKNTMVHISTVMHISNKTQFQISCKELVHNMDQIWHIHAKDVKLTVDTGFVGKISYSVNINKDLLLKRTSLYNFIGSDFNVEGATDNTMSTLTNLQFISDSIFTFHLPEVLLSVYYNDIYIGYAPLSTLAIKPGLNSISRQDLIIESTASMHNRGILGEFFSNYIGGLNQKVIMKGPIANTKGYESTVIDGILEETVVAMGYTEGDLAFGGVVTSATQTGWKVGSETLRGAYANMLNPLNVPIRVVNLSAITIIPETVKYHVNIVPLIGEYDCETDVYASLSIGAGIYKNNISKTWFDVAANDKASYFVIAGPPKGSKPDTCLDVYPFSCCFASLTTAYACKLNPEIQSHPSDGELAMDYMPLQMKANITMLIDNIFRINTTVNQDFFPLYFGWQVYGGYASDLELSCKSFTFK